MSELTEKAMLVDVSISLWSARRYDRGLSEEVTTKHNAARDTARVNKLLVARQSIKAVEQSAGAVRGYHRTMTLPWMSEGSRILPAANYFAYMDGLRPLKAAFEQAVDTFVNDYPQLVRDARAALNGMFRAEDYPPVDRIRDRFRIDVAVLPVPDAGDFRVNLAEAEAKGIREEIEQRVQAAFRDATADIVERIRAAVERVGERLRLYSVDGDGKVKNPFRDSLVENVKELIELVPRLNVTGDPEVARLADGMRGLVRYDADTLRDDESARTDTARQAEQILDSMKGVYGG